jgi:hypothetical protein
MRHSSQEFHLSSSFCSARFPLSRNCAQECDNLTLLSSSPAFPPTLGRSLFFPLLRYRVNELIFINSPSPRLNLILTLAFNADTSFALYFSPFLALAFLLSTFIVSDSIRPSLAFLSLNLLRGCVSKLHEISKLPYVLYEGDPEKSNLLTTF